MLAATESSAMDLRRWKGVRFVSRAPTRSGEPIRLRVARMTVPHVLWWHSHVQPIIDRDPGRTDRDWNWLLYVPFATLAGGVMARQPAGYTVGISAEEAGHFIPCALVQTSGAIPGPERPETEERLRLVHVHSTRRGSADDRGPPFGRGPTPQAPG